MLTGECNSHIGHVTSDICNVCGTKHEYLMPYTKEFLCSGCGARHVITDNNAKNEVYYTMYKEKYGKPIHPAYYPKLRQKSYYTNQPKLRRQSRSSTKKTTTPLA